MKRVVLPILLAASLVTVQRANAQQKVLAELFTNTNCGNCRVPEEKFGTFVETNTQYGVVRIVYHNEVTNPDDIFYVPAMGDVNAREQAYGLNANPLGIIDGYPLGNNETTWETTVKQAAMQSLPVTVTVSATKQGTNKYAIHVTTNGSINKQGKLYVALTESHIVYDNPNAYGNPTSGYWDDIFRMMLPTSTGSDAFALGGTHQFDYVADFSDQDWNAANMHVVAFVQETAPSAASSYQVDGLQSIVMDAEGVIDGRSVSSAVSATARGLRIETPSASVLTVQVTDVLGRTAAVRELRGLAAGLYNVDDLSLTSGAYIATVTADGKVLGTCKLVR